MPSAISTCPSCAEPLPQGARFCPACGHATPLSFNPATWEVAVAPGAPAGEEEGADHRARLQRALGDGLKIRRLLGRGGFAEVWSAFDVRLKREVAVKTLRYDLVISDTLLQRFQREAEAVAKLRHPNIIPIYEVGEGEGIAYFVMPMIEGESLGEALDREGQFSVEETCRIVRECAEALAAAHRAGIVHRDIKPDNIMLEGPERRPIVMDFGIAKATSGADAKLTGTGMAMGTPHYMSPEQASGETNLDARSDEYALALVAYRMLIGRSPFDADTMAGLIMKQITEVPKSVSSVRSDVPRELSDALGRALSKNPASRFATLEEFAAAIPRIGVGTGAASGRRRPSASEMAAFAGSTRPSFTEPLLLLGVLGIVITALIFSFAHPRAAAAAARQRTDALFIARAFLTKQGATAGSYDEHLVLAQDDTAFVWLEKSVGVRAADARAIADADGMLHWDLRWRRTGPGDSVQTWEVAVAPSGHVVSFTSAIPSDSAALPAISDDSAQRTAARFLHDAGIDVAAYARVTDSLVQRPGRTDRVLEWAARTNAVVSHGDTARQHLRIVVAGDRVRQYQASFSAPPRFVRAVRRDPWHTGVVTGVIIMWTALVLASIIIAVRRQRTDDLRWKAAARVSAVAIVLIGVNVLVATDANLGGAETVAIVSGLAFVGLFVLCGLMFGLVSGESLANEINPRALVGFDAIARLDLGSPAWGPALLRGLAVGAIAAALREIGAALAIAMSWTTASLPEVTNPLAALALAPTSVGSALVTTVIAFFAVHFLLRFTKRAWLAIALPGIAVGLMSTQPMMRPWLLTPFAMASFSVICWSVWRYGFLTAAVALFVSAVLPATVTLLAIGNDRYLTGGSIAVVVLVAIPVMAIVAQSRTRAVTPWNTSP